jgi:hypothetical protein
MRKLVAVSVAALACCAPHIALGQTAPAGPVSLILVTWLQPKGSAPSAMPTPAISVIGSFNDGTACMAAARQAQRANGDDAMTYNFICVPNR